MPWKKIGELDFFRLLGGKGENLQLEISLLLPTKKSIFPLNYPSHSFLHIQFDQFEIFFIGRFCQITNNLFGGYDHYISGYGKEIKILKKKIHHVSLWVHPQQCPITVFKRNYLANNSPGVNYEEGKAEITLRVNEMDLLL